MSQIHTFPLVWCERCGKATEPPVIHNLGLVVATEPLRCECGDLLMLLECAIHPRTEMWQERRGSTWHHVAFLHSLANLPR